MRDTLLWMLHWWWLILLIAIAIDLCVYGAIYLIARGRR